MLTLLVKCHDPLGDCLPDGCRQQEEAVSLLPLEAGVSLSASAAVDRTAQRSAACKKTEDGCKQLWRPAPYSTA